MMGLQMITTAGSQIGIDFLGELQIGFLVGDLGIEEVLRTEEEVSKHREVGAVMMKVDLGVVVVVVVDEVSKLKIAGPGFQNAVTMIG